MKLLVTGNGKSGSWKIRGDQLGHAIGAVVDPAPKSVNGYDAMILVKRPRQDALQLAHRAGVPVIYDVVDAWQQQLLDDSGRPRAIRWLESQIQIVRPAAMVAATRKMALDIEEAGFMGPVLALPHHARPNQPANPIRDKVATIGYEGAENYLGWWKPFLQDEARRRGWSFEINPPSLAHLDIVVAVREDTGYPTKHWKSNVKLANAQATGTPIICNEESGYKETDGGFGLYADDAYEMLMSLDVLEAREERQRYASRLRENELPLEQVAATYRQWLCSLKF